MSRSLKDQTLALAGVFQAANLVQQIAHNGQCNEASLKTSIRSLFATNPEQYADRERQGAHRPGRIAPFWTRFVLIVNLLLGLAKPPRRDQARRR